MTYLNKQNSNVPTYLEFHILLKFDTKVYSIFIKENCSNYIPF